MVYNDAEAARPAHTTSREQRMVTIAHPDKVEMYVVKTDETCKSLAAHFHNLAQMWQDRFLFHRWEDRPKILDEHGIWRAWEFVGRGSAVDLTVRGPAYHIEETSRRTRLFNEPGWIARLFPETQKGKHFLWPYLGWIRVASKDKREPEDYADILFSIAEFREFRVHHTRLSSSYPPKSSVQHPSFPLGPFRGPEFADKQEQGSPLV